MIRVNLLPDEYRPKEGASWAVLLTAMFVAAVVVLLIIGVVFFNMRAGKIKNDLETKTIDAAAKAKEAEEFDTLEAGIAAAGRRQTTIKLIAQSKVNWARQIDLLTNLILEGQMWLEELELIDNPKAQPGAGRGAVVTPNLRLMCYFVGEQPRLMTEFYAQLESSRAFFTIFDPEGGNRPQWERKNITDHYGVPFIDEHELNLLSVFELSMKPLTKPPQKKPTKPAAGGAAPKGKP